MFNSELARGVTVGAAIAVALGYVHSGGYDSEAIRETNDALAQYRFGRPSNDVHDPVVWVTGLASVGAAFGAATTLVARVLPVPTVVAGGAAGLAFRVGAEGFYRRMPGRRARWGFPPASRTATTLATYGAAVAIIGRGRLFG